jgi:hypothetical protein
MTKSLNANQQIDDAPRGVEDVIEQLEWVQQAAEVRGVCCVDGWRARAGWEDASPPRSSSYAAVRLALLR